MKETIGMSFLRNRLISRGLSVVGLRSQRPSVRSIFVATRSIQQRNSDEDLDRTQTSTYTHFNTGLEENLKIEQFLQNVDLNPLAVIHNSLILNRFNVLVDALVKIKDTNTKLPEDYLDKIIQYSLLHFNQFSAQHFDLFNSILKSHSLSDSNAYSWYIVEELVCGKHAEESTNSKIKEIGSLDLSNITPKILADSTHTSIDSEYLLSRLVTLSKNNILKPEVLDLAYRNSIKVGSDKPSLFSLILCIKASANQNRISSSEYYLNKLKRYHKIVPPIAHEVLLESYYPKNLIDAEYAIKKLEGQGYIITDQMLSTVIRIAGNDLNLAKATRYAYFHERNSHVGYNPSKTLLTALVDAHKASKSFETANVIEATISQL